jgi:hypothetical protein
VIIDVAIGKIRKLYAIEDGIKELKPAQNAEQRQTLAQPVLDDLKLPAIRQSLKPTRSGRLSDSFERDRQERRTRSLRCRRRTYESEEFPPRSRY